METFTIAWWRWRLIQALRRNPLVRTSDRIEAVVAAMVIATSLAAAPVAGAIGTALHDDRGRAHAAEAQNRRMVAATAIKHSTTVPRTEVNVVHARWRVGDTEHTERFSRDHSVRAGQNFDIWVGPDGRRVSPPAPSWRAGFDAFVAGMAIWLAVIAAGATLFGIVRPCLNHVRNAGWDRDIASLADDDGGRTNRQP